MILLAHILCATVRASTSFVVVGLELSYNSIVASHMFSRIIFLLPSLHVSLSDGENIEVLQIFLSCPHHHVSRHDPRVPTFPSKLDVLLRNLSLLLEVISTCCNC